MLQDVMARFEAKHSDWTEFPTKAIFQLNDTHPTIAVPEMMRLLMDVKGLDWDTAWDVTRKVGFWTYPCSKMQILRVHACRYTLCPTRPALFAASTRPLDSKVQPHLFSLSLSMQCLSGVRNIFRETQLWHRSLFYGLSRALHPCSNYVRKAPPQFLL